ncbi:hypothetical protein D3C87_2200480 [compost metagenome]
MEYGPMKARLDEQRKRALEYQTTLVKMWQSAVDEEIGHGDIWKVAGPNLFAS